jgi:hypothetical protein
VRSEDLLGRCLGNTVGEGEADALLEELLEVRALDVGGLLNLNNLEDLLKESAYKYSQRLDGLHTWIDRKRERWRAAMSW